MSRPTPAALGLAALFGGSGALHFAAPRFYEAIVPAPLRPQAGAVVAASGAAELVCAGLLLVPRTRRLGGLLSAALLVAVFPANVQMALDGGGRDLPGVLATPAAAWLRLPLQLPLIAWALRVARPGTAPA